MFAGLKKAVSAAAIAGLVLGAVPAALQAAETGVQPDGRAQPCTGNGRGQDGAERSAEPYGI